VNGFTRNPPAQSYGSRNRFGATPMTTTWRKCKVFAIVLAALACTATLLSVALAYSQLVSDPVLGDDWQCRKTMFLTSCTSFQHVTPTAENSRERICLRRV